MKKYGYGLFVWLLSLFTFYWLFYGVETNALIPFDNKIINQFYLSRSPLLTNLMIVISALGREIPIIFGALFTFALFFIIKHQKEALIFAFITGLAPLMSTILKLIFHRPRPPLYLHTQFTNLDFSFPSGHAFGSLVFYFTLSYFVYYLTKSEKLGLCIFVLSIILVSLIGISRIYLGVHYPTDVLAGFAGGIFWLSSLFLINKKFVKFGIRKKF